MTAEEADLNREIEKLEKRIPRKDLKKLQKEADLREYSDEEYLDMLKGWLDYEEAKP